MLTERHLTLLEERGLDAELCLRLGLESNEQLGPKRASSLARLASG